MSLTCLLSYGIYAAVFLYKAVFSGAYSGDEQRKEVATLVQRFTNALDSAASTNFHVCCKYSEMLRKLWARRGSRVTVEEGPDSPSQSTENHPETTHSRSGGLSSYKKQQPSDTQLDDADYLASFTNHNLDSLLTGTLAAEDVPSILLDIQLFGPFIPSVENIGNSIVYDNIGKQLLADLPQADMGLAGYQEISWNVESLPFVGLS